jgi:hypothetical protein
MTRFFEIWQLAKFYFIGGCTQMKKGKTIIVVSIVLCLVLAVICYSAVPRLLNYQGKLTDSSGNPLTGQYKITFTIWDSPTGGTALWSETHYYVPVSQGLFNVLLGSKLPINLPFDTDYYLGIKVENDSEMTPRQRIASSGYAINADMVDGKHAYDFLPSSGEAIMSNGSLAIVGDGNKAVKFRLTRGPFYLRDLSAPSADITISPASEGDYFQIKWFSSILQFINGSTEIMRLYGGSGISPPGVEISGKTKIKQQKSFEPALEVENTAGGWSIALIVKGRCRIESPEALFVEGKSYFYGDIVISSSVYISGGVGNLYPDGYLRSIGSSDKRWFQIYTQYGYSTNGWRTGHIMEGSISPTNIGETFEVGDVVIIKNGGFTKSQIANDKNVFGVIDVIPKDKEKGEYEVAPVILGVHKIKVVGSVKEGDFLVTSDVPGKAMVNNNPAPGTVIGQALEDGRNTIIKAMIRKF